MNLIYKLEDIKAAAKNVWKHAGSKKVWAFYGEMGAGKTTFIHALCEVLGVYSAIGSPTYSIINQYESKELGVIYHMDWYRLKDEEEALQAGVEDVLFSGKLCLIEWPTKAAGLLPDDHLKIYIELVDEETRKVSVE